MGSWRDVRAFVRTFWRKILGILVAFVVTTFGIVSVLTDRYEVTADLLVRFGWEQLEPTPAGRTDNTPVSTGLRREEIASETQMLKSPYLAAATVDSIGVDNFKPKYAPPDGVLARIKFEVKRIARGLKSLVSDAQIALGLKKGLTDREQAITWLLGDVTIVGGSDNDVMTVRLNTPDPVAGVQIINRWIDLYMQRRVQVRKSTGVQEFLDAEVKKARDRLASAESQELEWKRKHSLSSSKEQVVLLLKHIQDLAMEQDSTERQRDLVMGEITSCESLIAAAPQNVLTKREESPNPVLQKVKEELSSLQVQREKMLTKFQPDIEIIRNLDEQIARVSRLVEKEPSTQTSSTFETNPLMMSLERKLQENRILLEGLQAKTNLQTEQKRRAESELRRLDDADSTLVEIERERQLAEQSYLLLVKRKEEMDIAAELDIHRISNVSILTPPTSSIEPVYPRRLTLVSLSAALGLLLGLCFCLLLHYFDDRVRDPARLPELAGSPGLRKVSSSATPADGSLE